MTVKPNGYVLYEGPSRIDRKPIVVIAVGLDRKSDNAKTGGMVQTYILRQDMSPMDALRTGADASICGGCVHRPKSHDGKTYSARSCYVNVAQGPTVVWKSYKAGKYPTLPYSEIANVFAGKLVRFGSYGDPAAAPVIYWQAIKAVAMGTTGYTHQWRSERLRDTLSVCQLSADSARDVEKAHEFGVGSFRVLRHGELPVLGEFVCPASAEAGKKTTCAECRACDGVSKYHVVIAAHGIGANNYAQ